MILKDSKFSAKASLKYNTNVWVKIIDIVVTRKEIEININ